MDLASWANAHFCMEALFSHILLVLAVLVMVWLLQKLRRQKHLIRRSKMLDPVTGIGNMAFFTFQFHHAIPEQTREQYYVAFLAFDITRTDKFFGRVVSKQQLRYAARVLSQNVSPDSFAARVTYDGFAFVLRSLSTADAQLRVEKLLSQLNQFGSYLGFEHQIPFRAGVYHLKESDHSSEGALFNAQQGYLFALENHRPLSFSNEKLLASIKENAVRQQQITSALKNHEFKLFLQFIVDRSTKQIRGAEALSRWQHPTKGLLTPGQYIGIMEELGSICELDYYIFRETCKQLQEWNRKGYGDINVTCNFTRITISSPDFLHRIFQIAGEYDFDRSKLVMEITEDMAESDGPTAIRNMDECKRAGFQVALDDMGDGFSSFLNLFDYPLDYVKIDRAIVLNTNSSKGQALLNGMVALAHSMDIQVVCEGVETPQQNKAVCSSQCDFIQGFYYSTPIPQEKAEAFMATYNAALA